MQQTKLIEYFGCFSVVVVAVATKKDERELQSWQKYNSVSSSRDATSELCSSLWEETNMLKFLNLTHQKSLLHYLVYYLLLVLSIHKLFININTEINTNAALTHIQISNWNNQDNHTRDTIIFGQTSLEKPNAGKSVQHLWGFNYYAVFEYN